MSQEVCIKQQLREFIDDKICRTYGKPNKNRCCQPSMQQQILKWNDGENLKHDFMKDHLQPNPIDRYGNKIKKSSSPWMTEHQESYQPYLRVDCHHKMFPVDVKTLDKICRDQQLGRTAGALVAHAPHDQKCFIADGKHGVNTTDYGLRRVNSEQELRHILEANSYQKRCTGNRPTFQNILYLDHNGDIPVAVGGGTVDQQRVRSLSMEKADRLHSPHDKRSKLHKNSSAILHSMKRLPPKKLSKEQVVQIDPNEDTPILRQRQKKIKKFADTSRWISDTAFMTYYGKPPFNNYGRANTKPTAGGVVYGQYLFSHNVSPHRGANSPKYLQSYVPALNAAESLGTLYPEPPRLRNEENITDQEVEAKIKLNPIYPKQNNFDKVLKIQKPDLINSYVFSENPNPQIFVQKQPTHRIPKKNAKKTTLQQILKNKKANKAESNVNQLVQAAKPVEGHKRIRFEDNTAETIKVDENTKTKVKLSKPVTQPHKSPEPQLKFLPERQNGFMKQKQLKKQKDNRIALKVTEVVCTQGGKKIQQDEHKSTNQHAQCKIDYLYHDPRNYKNVPSHWLRGIPAAGKALERNLSAAEVLDQKPQCQKLI